MGFGYIWRLHGVFSSPAGFSLFPLLTASNSNREFASVFLPGPVTVNMFLGSSRGEQKLVARQEPVGRIVDWVRCGKSGDNFPKALIFCRSCGARGDSLINGGGGT